MMKSILTTIVFLALAISGFAQTRSVIVNTSGVVQSPTNFWSADVTNARSGLGLGTAATNPASAFQPSSATLSNLSSGNGSGLTNVTASSISSSLAISNTTGLQSALDSKLATNGNTTGTASNVTGVVALANGGTGGTNAASARTSLGSTTVGGNIFTLANPDDVRFLRLNANNSVSALTASDMRTALSVGTNLGTVTSIGMTVPSFLSVSTPTITSSGTFALTLANQTSRQVLIAPNGGGAPVFRGVESDDLPSLAISKITGLQTALDGKLATGGTATLATNVTGVVALANGGTGGTDAATARTGLGATTAGSSMFTLINPSAIRFLRLNNDNTMSALSDSDFRTAIGLGTAATNPATAFQPSSSVLTNLANNNGSSLTNISASGVVGILATNGNGGGLTNLTAANITGTVGLASNVTGTIAISNGGSGATTAGGARTNLGLGATWLTNASREAFQADIFTTNQAIYAGGPFFTQVATWASSTWVLSMPLDVTDPAGPGLPSYKAVTRTNLGLGWPALTNTSTAGFNTSLYGSGTNPVLYNTNGEVVSPTNFWQVAPIVTRFVESQPVANQTTNITAARNLHIHSLAISTTGVTNTIALPTTNSFDGDIALVVHQGPTSSVTAVRTAGATNNLVTMNQPEEAVEFVYYNNVWQFNHNRSFVEPIFFSGTNATANAAASRTNLGLGWSALTNTNATTFRTAIGLGTANEVTFATVSASFVASVSGLDGTSIAPTGVQFNGVAAATTRTNLGLGGGVTTNIDIKLNNNNGMRLYFTNGILTNAVTPIP